MNRYPFTPFPRGWFRVAFSKDVKIGQVKPLKYFGKELVVFRTNDGKAHVLDAICPHLGANLGKGGVVVENTLRCPFHGWRFAGDGSCAEIPYCEKIPAKAKLAAWPVNETHGFILAYFDPEGQAPTFEVPALDEYASGNYAGYHHLRWNIKCHVQELVENAIDYPHFTELHEYKIPPTFTKLDIEGQFFRTVMESKRQVLGKTLKTVTDIRYHGPGYIVSPVSAGPFQIIAILTPTPIDEQTINIHCSVLFKRWPIPFANWLLPRFLVMPTIKSEFERDIPIWEQKAYHARPVLCAGDGPIMRIRKWSQQFYEKSPSIAA